jgi:hypothetical protein
MNIIDNRRHFGRVSTVFSVDIQGHGGNFAVDVGCGGLRLVARKPLAEDEIEFCLHLSGEVKLVLKGRPVWQQQMSRNGKTMAGVSFAHGQDRERELLRGWLDSYSLN